MPAKILGRWVLLLIFLSGFAAAQQIDPHAVYEQDCAGCHAPHAGEFVFDKLKLLNDSLVAKKTGQPVSVLLESGHGGLSPAETEAILDLFLNIRQSGRLFFEKCRICHINAKELARINLIVRDDRLMGRYTGRDIAEFLLDHGRLELNEITIMVEVLKRHLVTASTTKN